MSNANRVRTSAICFLGLLAVCSGAAGAVPATRGSIGPTADLQAIQNAFEALAQKVAPTVVAIKSIRVSPKPPATREGNAEPRPHQVVERRTSGAGSGFIIRADGMILTNEHVIHEADDIVVHLYDGREFGASIVQIDTRSDLAVLQIEAHGLRAAVLGDVANLRQGHLVFAMGNPFGVASEVGHASMSWGIVSALGRPLPLLGAAEDRYYGNLIETTAPINPGNSGGPLFDIYGHVVGINTAISTRSGRSEGVGFAVPIGQRTRRIIETLMRGDEVQYGLLGVFTRALEDPQRAATGAPKGRGAWVESVEPDCPAEKAGIVPGDVIVKFDGQDVMDADHLVRMVGGTPPGQRVEIVYYRNRKPVTTQIALARRERNAAEDTAPFHWRGLTVTSATAEQRRVFKLTDSNRREITGVVIGEVRPASPAQRAGLKPGMIVESVGDQAVSTLRQFRQAVRTIGSQPARITVQGGQTFQLPPG
jgi:serine protease Do